MMQIVTLIQSAKDIALITVSLAVFSRGSHLTDGKRSSDSSKLLLGAKIYLAHQASTEGVLND
jgi:hypothetical protein